MPTNDIFYKHLNMNQMHLRSFCEIASCLAMTILGVKIHDVSTYNLIIRTSLQGTKQSHINYIMDRLLRSSQ